MEENLKKLVDQQNELIARQIAFSRKVVGYLSSANVESTDTGISLQELSSDLKVSIDLYNALVDELNDQLQELNLPLIDGLSIKTV